MIVERQALRAAIVQAYRLLLDQPSHCLRAADLEQRWVDSGIRRADLDVTLREMLHRHLIAESGNWHDLAYRLTPQGIKKYPVLRGNLFTRLGDAYTLLRIRLRALHSRSEAPATRRRWRDLMIEPRLRQS